MDSETIPEVDGDLEVSKGRTDLRHLPFMTIDPHDAKDFDDAVCLVEKMVKMLMGSNSGCCKLRGQGFCSG